jgi:hypothetical protein
MAQKREVSCCHISFSQVAAATSSLLIVLLMIPFCLVKGSGRYYFGYYSVVLEPAGFFQ